MDKINKYGNNNKTKNNKTSSKNTGGKLGIFTLTGLIIGPLLGSGIVMMPPLVHETLGDYSIFGWIFMMTLSGIFAYIASKLCVLFPGDSGLADVVEYSFGKSFRNLTATYLIFSAFMGPVIVLMVSSEYLSSLIANFGLALPAEVYVMILISIAFITLLKDIAEVGKISTLLSGIISVVLLTGGLFTIAFYRKDPLFVPITLSSSEIGNSFLIMFWSIIGWEILGNYSLEVEHPKKIIPKSALLAVLIVSTVYFVVSFAIQAIDTNIVHPENMISMLSLILYPLFGDISNMLLTITITGLCFCAYMMIIGGVSRLINSQALNGAFPSFLCGILSKRNKSNVPIGGIGFLYIMNIITVLILTFKLLNLTDIITMTNAFLIGNALLSLLASVKVFKNSLPRFGAILLSICFTIILMFSSPWVLSILGFFLVVALFNKYLDKK
ncbi:APC family permease [Methanococcus voltae]|uniref:Amino acid permease-associated region n=1 Tax=Methanococcus voltae (strain ATCC BAA-1334 / A3) TaxID=456320 RepID=D7DTB6_METV3|nr:APC family permease [Methanococcus voltae]MCS3901227.1 APA family basic amino acid/polyamine antiporter [Methanococcus voltae]